MSSELEKIRHSLAIEDEQSKRIILLEASTYTVGRDPENSIMIHSKWVSRQHAILLRVTVPQTTNYAFRIVDGDLQGKRSTNGLFVNGHRCFSHDLKHGDLIQLGKETLATYCLMTGISNQDYLDYCETGEIPDTSSKTGKATTFVPPDPDLESLNEAAVMRLASFPEMTPIAIIESDLKGNITYINPAAKQRFPGLGEQGVTHPLITGLWEINARNQTKEFVRELRIEDEIFQQFIQYIPESDLIRSYVMNVTAYNQTGIALQKSEAKTQALFNAIPDAILHLNLNGKILDFKSARDVTLFESPQDVVQQDIYTVLPALMAQQMMHFLKPALANQEPQVFEYEQWQNNDLQHYEIRLVASGINEALAIIRNITERKLAEKQLLHDALHDPLTGLPNRLLFWKHLTHAINLSHRRKESTFAVMFIDLDRFKIVNDSLGHNAGDQLLITVSRQLESCLRSGDTVARLGGDEFAILLEDLTSLDDAIVIADRLLHKVSQPIKLNHHEIFVSASIGIASGKLGYEHPEEILRDADTAMYHAKALGKARYEVFDQAMHQRVVALLKLDNELRRAVERQEFRLLYQPIISLKTGKVSGFETLVRWQHPEQGLVSPNEFIQLAEETGLILPLGEWILYEACHQAYLWQLQFPTDLPLSVNVNLSGKQFAQRHLVDQINQVLHRTSLPADSLKLEITESVVMENTRFSKETFLGLKDLGVQLYIDDFGTGYSSLSYLHRFPIDALKVDRSFINGMNLSEDNSQVAITQTIIFLARTLNLCVVAEGVEGADQLAQLRALNCDYAQGFFFAKPLDVTAAEAFLVANHQW